jgi:hypothetical protein
MPGQQPAVTTPEQGGCWVAYYHDRSAVSVFGSEIEALRHAVERQMTVRFQPWGEVEFQ